MKVYENIEAERDRIQNCIKKFGWTSDHNLDWFLECMINDEGRAVFVDFEDSSGLLAYKYNTEYTIWSDPLCDKNLASEKIIEFSKAVLGNGIKEVWCADVSENIRKELVLDNQHNLKIGDTWYSLLWPVLDMNKCDLSLSGRHFKDIRNARNKFYREHDVKFISASEAKKEHLHKIVDTWKNLVSKNREDIYESKYHKAIDNNFRGFKTARIMIIDGKPAGINAGYEVINKPGRFGGIIGIHDYSFSDNGTILWLEDLEWIKKAGYKEMDMQGSEDDGGLKFKMQFNPIIERRTDTFLIAKP